MSRGNSEYRNTQGYVTQRFADLRALADYLDNTPRVMAGDSLRYGWQDVESNGTVTRRGARSMMLDGWKEGAEGIERKLAELKPMRRHDTTRVASKHDYIGSSVNVGRAMSGKPKAMTRTVRVAAPTRTVKLVYDIAILANVTTEEQYRIGACVLALVTTLQYAGFRVALDMAATSIMRSGHVASVRLNVKDFSEPLNVMKIAFPIAHSDMFRTAVWGWRERQTEMASNRGGGSACSLYATLRSEQERAREDIFAEPYTYYFNYADVRDSYYDMEELAAKLGMTHLLDLAA